MRRVRAVTTGRVSAWSGGHRLTEIAVEFEATAVIGS